ncbi:MAG TPA: hypothetical protein EYN79_01155 [Planctomycetes bacterium]|nr:hypothetical protein [Planctomycetota bacterium]HIN79697.1 hypothetical protein [Planctomycetota bacterium]
MKFASRCVIAALLCALCFAASGCLLLPGKLTFPDPPPLARLGLHPHDSKQLAEMVRYLEEERLMLAEYESSGLGIGWTMFCTGKGPQWTPPRLDVFEGGVLVDPGDIIDYGRLRKELGGKHLWFWRPARSGVGKSVLTVDDEDWPFEGTRCLRADVFPSMQTRTRGTVCLIQTLMGSAAARPFIIELTRQGWRVISVDQPLIFAAIEVIKAAGEPQDLSETGAQLAAEVDGLIVDVGLTLKAALEAYPADGPVLLVGVSQGALLAPGVALVMAGEWHALGVGLGGGDILRLLDETSFSERQRPEWLMAAEFRDAYLDSTRFDPLIAARQLRGQRVFVLRALFDRIVPASVSDPLYEALGRPPRWTFVGGHLITVWAWKKSLVPWLQALMKYTLESDEPQAGDGEDVAEVDLGEDRWVLPEVNSVTR